MKRVFTIVTVTVLVLVTRLMWGTTGYKYFKNYTTGDFGQYPQNWSILQDKRGVIYSANSNGLLEFDGTDWRLILIPDYPNIEVRSIAIDSSGNLYVGGKYELGYFTGGPVGPHRFTSLLDRLTEAQKDFYKVWMTHTVGADVFFVTTKFLFRWRFQTRELKIWEAEKEFPFRTSFVCSGRLFIRVAKKGLKSIRGNHLQLVPGGAFFKDKTIFMMASYGEDRETFLIGTRGKGFYLYDGKSAVPFDIEPEDYIRKNKLSQGLRLRSGDFALTTLHGGLVVIDAMGKLKYLFNEEAGLQENNVKGVFEDRTGNLWLSLNDGITKVEYASPFSMYDDRSHLKGHVLAVQTHGSRLYAGTDSGVYVLPGSGKFNPEPVLTGYCGSFISWGDTLLAATVYGVYAVEDNKTPRLILNYPSYTMLRSQIDTNRIWVGTSSGLMSVYFDVELRQWETEHTFKGIKQQIRTLVEDINGNLWLGLPAKGVLNVDFQGGGVGTNPVIATYNKAHGLPDGEIKVFKAAGHVMFTSQAKGIFRFDEKVNRFIPDTTLGERFAGGGKGVFCIARDRDNHIWLHSRGRNYELTPVPDGAFKIDPTPFLRQPLAQVNAIYPDPGGHILWIAGNNVLTRYERRLEKNYRQDFTTLIREVKINGRPLFYHSSRGYKSDDTAARPEIQFKDRNLRFKVSAPFYEETWRTSYRYFLEGYNDGWSAWTNEDRKDYTNLDAGDYKFRAQARNIYNHPGSETVYQFKVLPPWYQTWWAMAAYAMLALLGVYLVVRLRSGKLEKEKQKLEQVVKERTREIHQKSRQLETQTLQLQDQARKLQDMAEVKSRFFANISHEFRTPLTLIMGPLEQIQNDYRGKDENLTKKARLMLRNSQRLFTLINRLLDLSKLDSGKMQLQSVRQNIVPFLKGIVASFEMMANQNDLDLTFHSGEADITLYFDTEKLEDVLCNLLVNAVKFTPAGGKVTVSAKQVPNKEKHFPSGYLEISVSDTGPGIPREQLAQIFDRFFQSDRTHELHRQGFGIGLALTRELINLHHGQINVHSRAGDESGTEFIIRLPLGKELYEPKEIASVEGMARESLKTAEITAAAAMAQEIGTADHSSEPPQAEIDPLNAGKNIILVVDDSADIRQYIRGALEPLYTVSEANSGQEGIRKAQSLIPDLIISDIMMPEVNGYQLCDTLKKDIKTSHIPIILLTARASEKDIIHGLETGADDYITKPFSTRMLVVRIKNLIDLRRHFQLTLYRQMTRQPAKMAVSKIDREFIKELQDVIEKNLADPDFNVEQLGKKLYMSRATLYRKIHALSGESPNEFIQSYRLKRASELLEKKFGTVLEVAFETGFSSASYFTKCFKKKFNCLPSEYPENPGTL